MCERGQVAVGRHDVEPLGKEQVDLLDVLLERGVARWIVLDVVGGTKTFPGVQGDVRGTRSVRRCDGAQPCPPWSATGGFARVR